MCSKAPSVACSTDPRRRNWSRARVESWQRAIHSVIVCESGRSSTAFKLERGWHHLPLYSDISGEFSRDSHALTKNGGNDAAFNVFTKREDGDGQTIRHFWGGEMNVPCPIPDRTRAAPLI
jgi:predicted dithiol-disulfide oxidoreductase (DUF899 family)